MTIDVIIPNYNGLSLLKESLPKVIEEVEKFKGFIIIVDDGSDHNEFEELNAFVKKLANKHIVLLRNERNLGFSSTVNRGVAESNADFVVFLNTDVVPESNFLEAALKGLQSNDNLFGVGFMDKSIEDGADRASAPAEGEGARLRAERDSGGRKIVLRGRGLAKWEKGFLVHRRGEVDETDTFWISGGSSILRRDLFDKLGGFDNLYDPFYWEDIDLSYRAQKSGYTIKFEPKSIVTHKHSEGSIKKYFSGSQVKIIAYRNQFIFVWKNITDLSLMISHLLWLPYHLLTSILRFDISFLSGFLLALIRLPAIIMKRSEQKKFYKARDLDLLNAR